MKNILPGWVIVIGLSLASCNGGKKEEPPVSASPSAGNPAGDNASDTSKRKIYYPFEIYRDDSHTILADIQSKKVFDDYNSLFEKYHYTGNGYSWEGHIQQILQKENPSLLSHIEFDSEAGGFFAYADNETTQTQFAELLSRIFRDIPKLEAYVKSADRSKISD